jgi:hypothetical protein
MPSFRFRRRHSSRALLTAGARLAVAVATSALAGTGIFRNGFEALVPRTVQDVQQGAATGVVYLPGRVVTARSADGKHLWIADANAAAAFQGVYVFRGVGAAALGAEFVPGARVDVLGDVSEFDAAPPGDTLTQIANAGLVLAGPPQGAPQPLVFASVAQLASIAEGEAWEGVLVQATNLRVSAVLSGNRVVVLDNGGNMIVIDDDAGSIGAPFVGTCYASVTGVMHLNTVDNERRLLPRGPSDATTGNGCN